MLGDEGGGAEFAIAEFRMFMNVAAPSDHLRLDRRSFSLDSVIDCFGSDWSGRHRKDEKDCKADRARISVEIAHTLLLSVARPYDVTALISPSLSSSKAPKGALFRPKDFSDHCSRHQFSRPPLWLGK